MSALGPCVLPAAEDGLPLRPAILYGIDSRASAQVERLTAELGAEEILARCGSQLSSQSAGPKIRWLADQEPQVWSATRRVLGATSFIVSRLTGEYVLDHHSASHWAPLYDVHRNAWIEEWQERVAPGLPLPRLVWPQERCGTVSREAAAATGLPEGIPVAGGSIDSWCEVTASGLRGPGRGLLVYGTSMFLTEVDSPARPDPRLWSTVGFTPGSLNIAAGVASAGALTAWLRDLTGDVDYDTLYAEAAAAGPGAGGLLALPYFAGERTPLFDPAPARRDRRSDRRARARPPLPRLHGGGRVRRPSEPGDDARGRRDRRASAQQRRRGGRRPVAADRQRRHRPGAGRARGPVPGRRRRSAARRRRRGCGDHWRPRGRSRRCASSPTLGRGSCTTSSTGGSATYCARRVPSSTR